MSQKDWKLKDLKLVKLLKQIMQLQRPKYNEDVLKQRDGQNRAESSDTNEM